MRPRAPPLAPAPSALSSPAYPAGSPCFAQDVLDQNAKLGAHILAQRPVYRDVAAHGFDQFARDRPQRLIAEYLDRAVVGF